jgi:hypothetical protein
MRRQASHYFIDLLYRHQGAAMHGVARLPAGFAARRCFGGVPLDVRSVGGGRLRGILGSLAEPLAQHAHLLLQTHYLRF